MNLLKNMSYQFDDKKKIEIDWKKKKIDIKKLHKILNLS